MLLQAASPVPDIYVQLDGSNQASWTPTTTLVPNLNADMLDGLHVGTSGAAIGALNAANTWSALQLFTDDVRVADDKRFWIGSSATDAFFIRYANGVPDVVQIEGNQSATQRVDILIKGTQGSVASTSIGDLTFQGGSNSGSGGLSGNAKIIGGGSITSPNGGFVQLLGGLGSNQGWVTVGSSTSQPTRFVAGANDRRSSLWVQRELVVDDFCKLAANLDGLATLTAGLVGELNGVQGDLVYYAGTNTVTVLNKNASATRYLSNTGSSNNPAWAQVNLTNGVTGILPAANLPDAAADGTTKGIATFTAADFNSSSGLISIDYTNGQAASGSTKGFLTSADWTTFNSKENALTFNAPLTRSVNTISFDTTVNFTWTGNHQFNGTLVKQGNTSLVGYNLTQTLDQATKVLEVIPKAYNDATGIGTDNLCKKWNAWISDPASMGAGEQPNRAFVMGYNFGQDGVNEESDDASFGDRWEWHYNPSGTQRWFERHICSTPRGSSTQYRALSINFAYPTKASNTAPSVTVDIAADSFSYLNSTGSIQYFKFFNGYLFATHSTSVFTGDVNNVSQFKQINAGASAYKSLAYLNSDDVVILGETGVPIQTVESLTIPDDIKLYIGDNTAFGGGSGNLSISNDVSSSGNVLIQPENGFGGGVHFSGLGVTIDGSSEIATSSTNYLKVGISLSAPQATLDGNTHAIFVTKQETSTTGAIAGLFEAEFAGASASSAAIQACNLFSHNTSSSGNLTATTAGGGLRSRALTRQRSTSGTIAQMSCYSLKITQDASTATVSLATPLNIETPDVGSSATMTEFRGINFETAAATGTLTTNKFVHFPSMSAGTNRYECWWDADAGGFYREPGNQINSRASGELDIDATTTMNLRIGGTVEALLNSTELSLVTNDLVLASGAKIYLEGSGSDTYIYYDSTVPSMKFYVNGVLSMELK